MSRVPLRWRISSSTRPKDMRPKVRPDMIPANTTRKQEIPAYKYHITDPNAISVPRIGDEEEASLVANLIISTAFTQCISQNVVHFLDSHTCFSRGLVMIVEKAQPF
ncbi:hypothetical protein Leryth_002672 [Lithospermum erythrorhizon]|nr:hypothetical protein Leryth_002672 [Lithospermum erythrorhizon]